MLERLKSLLLRRRSNVVDTQPSDPETHELSASIVTPFIVDPKTSDIDDMGNRAAEAVDALSEELEDWFQVDFRALTSAWQGVQDSPRCDTARRAIFRAAHNLGGTDGLYYRPEVSRLCRSIARLAKRKLARSDIELIGLHIDACHATISNASERANAEQICEALEQLVTKRVAA